MLKLYKLSHHSKLYWETWQHDSGVRTIHWGQLGHRGKTREIGRSGSRPNSPTIEKEIERAIAEGFVEIPMDEHLTLVIEYEVDGFGDSADLEKRHRLEDRMNETLGWTGLGHCDGGSIGSGTMEVCCVVVDFEIANSVVENDLANTEFSDFSRIHNAGDMVS